MPHSHIAYMCNCALQSCRKEKEIMAVRLPHGICYLNYIIGKLNRPTCISPIHLIVSVCI